MSGIYDIQYPMNTKAFIHMSSLIIVSLVWMASGLEELSCSHPQKTAYLSFKALSKMDTMPKLFSEINLEFIHYDFIYNKSAELTFNMSRMHPQIYYNEHHQVENYIDAQTANVSLGPIVIAFSFDYQVKRDGQVKEGFVHGRQVMDEAYFTKKLRSDNGSLEWAPGNVPKLTLSSQLHIDISEPTLTSDELQEFEMMLNDQVGERALKETILASLNIYYAQQLKEHLNSEHMFANTKFVYYWDQYFYYLTPQVNARLVQNGSVSGLLVGFLLQLENYTQMCSDVPEYLPTKQLGGNQEMISMATINSTFINAVHKKLFNAHLYSTWEIPELQFRMGDLSNVCPAALDDDPSSFFYLQCNWDESDTLNHPKIEAFTEETLQAKIPYICMIRSSSQQIIEVRALMQFIIKFNPEEGFLKAVVDSTGVSNVRFKAMDSKQKYVITDENLAYEYIRKILAQLRGTRVFGTNWKTQNRKFPAVRVTDNYIVIYDASQE